MNCVKEKIGTQKVMVSDKIYEALMNEVDNQTPDISKVMFLTGAVHALRAVNGYTVPEIEIAFINIIKQIGKEELECLLTHFTVQ